MQHLKTKQIYTGNHNYGEVLLANGNSGITIAYPQLQKGNSFPTNSNSGDTYFYLNDDLLYYFDGIRNKWLSVSTVLFELGRNTLAYNTAGYLGIADTFHSSTNGIILPKNGTITAISIQNSTSITRTIEVRLNNSAVNKVDISLEATSSKVITNTNLDFSVNDLLHVYVATATSGNTISAVSCIIEINWRH
jgi:hypothetical protein